MSTTPEQLRGEYLRRLDAAMAGIPHGVATEIRVGIAEELSGLDADAAAARIAQLGEPAEIAREAASAASASAPAPVEVRIEPVSHSRGFATIAALTLSFGGFVLPGLGWLVGVVLVSMSPLWRTWEKTVAIVVPLASAAASIAFGLTAWAATGAVAVSGSDVTDPLGPSGYDMFVTVLAVLGLLLIPLSGLWLLWRMRDRGAPRP